MSDVEASAAWYTRVLGMSRVPWWSWSSRGSGVMIGLHHHQANLGDEFDERRNGAVASDLGA